MNHSGSGGGNYMKVDSCSVNYTVLATIEPSLVMPAQPSLERVQEMTAEIERLCAELAAAKAPPALPPSPIYNAIKFSGSPRSLLEYSRLGFPLIS